MLLSLSQRISSLSPQHLPKADEIMTMTLALTRIVALLLSLSKMVVMNLTHPESNQRLLVGLAMP